MSRLPGQSESRRRPPRPGADSTGCGPLTWQSTADAHQAIQRLEEEGKGLIPFIVILVRQSSDLPVEARLEFGNAFINEPHYFFLVHDYVLLVSWALRGSPNDELPAPTSKRNMS
jgi:hypothetical protein